MTISGMNEHNLAHVKPFHHVKCDAYREQSRKAKPESECAGSGLGRYAARPFYGSLNEQYSKRVSQDVIGTALSTSDVCE